MNVLAIIPARGGSKGIPRKNIAMCAGKPLIQWTIEAARLSSKVNTVMVSADNADIANIALDHSVTLSIRPDELSTDTTSTEDVLAFHLEDEKADAVVLLQPTSPVRSAEHIDEAIGILGQGYDSVVSVVLSHCFLWHSGEDSAVPLYHKRVMRQEMEQYEENGSIYVFTMEHWRRERNRLGGKTALYMMPDECRYQIDTPFDLWLCEQILLKEDVVVSTNK